MQRYNLVGENMAQIVDVCEGRIQLPPNWLEKWQYPARLVIEETGECLLIRPMSHQSWDEVFRAKVRPFVAPEQEEVEVERSDLFL